MPNDEEEGQAPPSVTGVPVVGVGASAGGIGALERLVPLLRPGAGVAYVVVLHLDPDHASILSTLLARVAKIPVVEIKHQTALLPDHVYVIPPNARLAMSDGRLEVSVSLEPRGRRMPIDGFLSSLAVARGEKAAGIILSGTGSDGTIGLRAIKEQGGLTVAQDDAEHDGMMRSAVHSGMVDFVLAVEDIPGKIYDYFQHLAQIDGRKGSDGVRHGAASRLERICALLRARTGHDFSGYKEKTVARRVQRRMQVLQIDEVPDYIERLRKEPEELDALLQDLLIGVTNFFRDRQAFAALEREVIPALFAGKGSGDTVRVWIPGCSTGEEAYSIAMLLSEARPEEPDAPSLQIFASDIDEQSLQIARTGRFPATIAKDLTPARLERHFVREDGTYRVAADLREICLFSAHNLLRDAPFSKLDLVACRNLLIYLTPELQSRLIPLFHYALVEGGFLFLGSSENVTRHSRLFATVDKVHRIFRRRPQIERRLPEFPLTAPDGGGRRTPPPRAAAEHEPLQSIAERQLLDRYAPAYVVISGEGELLLGSPRTGKYLELAPGTPRMDVYSMARAGLRPDLRAAVYKAANTGQVVLQKGITVGTNGGRQSIDLVVQPIRPSAVQDPLYMVIFQDVGGITPTTEAETLDSAEELENATLRQLEMELKATRERLQTTTEELESSNEELKSGNEELSSINEELQSANEELETSKEELQSINEELQTVNLELNARVEELSRANSLLDLLPVGILIIGDELGGQIRVNRYGATLVGQRDSRALPGLRPLAGSLRLFQAERELGRDEHPLYRAAHGEAVAGFEGEIARLDGSRVDVLISATPLFDEAGKVRGGIAAILDISERRAVQAHQQILLYELQHRVKNIITTIGALATRMLKDSQSLEQFTAAFLGRLRAMATAHDLLSRGNWTDASLRDLVETALGPQFGRDSPAVGLEGDDLVLAASTAATLGLVFYELATNATKYGSLSGSAGRVDIAWRIGSLDGSSHGAGLSEGDGLSQGDSLSDGNSSSGGDRVVLSWVESGGPAPRGPFNEGFGTAFVRRTIEYELAGTAELQLAAEGLRWTITFPLDGNVQGYQSRPD